MSGPWTIWEERREELARTPLVVLHGGTSSERRVSLVSGRAVLEALAGHGDGPSADIRPPVHEVEILEDGCWRVAGAPLAPTAALEALPEDAVFVLALHGGMGEDGTLQGFLEVAGRAYTGAGPATSSLCMDKHLTRLAARAAGLDVAPGDYASHSTLVTDRSRVLARLCRVPGPVRFAKHACAGSSVDVYRCEGDEELARACDAIAASGGDVLVESEVRGLEVTCGVVGDAGGDVRTLPVVEILPKDGRFFDFDEKYSASGAHENCPPEYLPDVVARRVQERAIELWRAVRGTSYGRIDFIVPTEDRRAVPEDARPVLLEANTLPGFTPRSLLPMAAAADGVGFRALCLELAARALARRGTSSRAEARST